MTRATRGYWHQTANAAVREAKQTDGQLRMKTEMSERGMAGSPSHAYLSRGIQVVNYERGVVWMGSLGFDVECEKALKESC